MAAAQCVNGPHGRPGPRQPVPQPGAEAPNPGRGPPGPGARGSIHPPPPHLHQARPYFYMQPPPMAPLMHYQWPMPIPYNPYSGFPGMGVSGYSMVMPQFPPTAFMEAPSYVLPHAQLLPADYRRVLQPPYPQTAAHYQNLTQNPTRRFHFQPNPGCAPKETVSSEVQTEPMFPDVRKASPAFGNKDPLACSDSGRGTGSSAPSSPGSSVGKAGSCPEEERNSIPSSTSKTLFMDKGRSQGMGTPTRRKKSQSRRISIEALARVGAELGHFDMSSVCSSDSMFPVCSSSNRDDDVIQGRRVSFPDILMGGLASPAVPKTPDVPRCEHKEPQDEEEKENRDLAAEEKDCDLTREDCDLTPEDKENRVLTRENCDLTPEDKENRVLTLEDCDSPEDCDLTLENCDVMDELVSSHSKILKLPFKLHEYILGPKKANESVWSVESLAPYIPTTEWLIQNGLLDPANIPQKVLEMNGNDTSPQQKSFKYVQIKKTGNESVWSVDSLPPYVPSADWLIQNDSGNYENVVKEMEWDAVDLSQTHLLKRMMAVKESRQKLLFSESSVDSLPPYVPSASWLADQGNVYYCSKMHLSSQQDGDVFLNPSDELGLYRRPNMVSELGHSKDQHQQQPQEESGNPKRSLNFEFLEKVGMESSEALPSTIPNVEKDPKNGTLEGSMDHGAQCGPNVRTLDGARNRCPPDHTKPTISIHIELERVHANQEVELDQEMAKNVPTEPNQQLFEKMVMGALTSMSIPTYLGHSPTSGLQCFKVLERYCPCEDRSKQHTCSYRKSPVHTGSDEDRPKQQAGAYRKSPLRTGSDEDRPKQQAGAYRKSPQHTGSHEERPMQQAGAYRKSPLRTGSDEDGPKQQAGAHRKSPLHTGSDENEGNMPSASKHQGKRRGHGFQWKPERARGANKPRTDRESNNNGHGQKNSKKCGQWKNRPQQDRSQTQTHLTNKPFNQRTSQRNRQERPIMATMVDLVNHEEEMEGTH